MHISTLLSRLSSTAAQVAWRRVVLAAVVIAAAAPALAQVARDGVAKRRDVAQPIRILPLGDSITQGGRQDRPEYTYRYPLFYMLKDAGYAVDFIGSLNTGLQPEAVWPDKNGVPFDRDHEGHYGISTLEARKRLPDWMEKYAAPADMALIHLGSNDYDAANYDRAIITPLKEIIALLRQKNPNVVILVGHMLESGRKARALRPMIERMVREQHLPQSPVVSVAFYEGWISKPGPGSDTFDWAHPNPQGQQKMADKWFAAMVPFLKRMQSE